MATSTLSEPSDSEDETYLPNRSMMNRWNNTEKKRKRTSSSSDSNDDNCTELQNKKSKLWIAKESSLSESDDEHYIESQSKKQSSWNMRDDGSGESGDEDGSAKEPLPLPTTGVYNSIAQKMMQSMGYKAGTGLGKYGQGRTEIVEVSKQRGRRGLGLHLEGLEPADIEWDFEKEQISVKEEIYWMPPCTEPPPSLHLLRQWIKEGQKKLTIDDETTFCDPDVLRNVLACKNVFDKLEPEEMRRARTRSNPFETIRGVIFQNRAAVKMANMDAIFDFMFTDPRDEDGNSVLSPHELLYFADICAGPGGFSEYVLWKKKWEAKGFGFTLKGPNDFKLEEFFAGPPESFEPHYGVNGIEGDGDIYSPQNLREFQRFVLENTDKKGVHFVMADGGFSVEGNENIQEILSKRLYLCQFLCALSILRTGGHFVCKLFDVFTPFSVGLVYLMYRSFKHISIHKPNTSRPANSERYIICKDRLPETKDIHDYMYEVNCTLGQLSLSDKDVVEVVPLKIIKNDQPFFEYIVDSNNRLGEQQIISLAKIRAFAQNTNLYEERQSSLRKECLDLWQLPDRVRSAPARSEPSAKFRELMKGEDVKYLGNKPIDLDLKTLQKIKSVYNYCCVVSGIDKISTSDRGFFLGLGRNHIFRWDGVSSPKWSKLDLQMDLPAQTLMYAELVQELKGEGRAQRKITAMHVIDALYLGGKDVRNLPYIERMIMASKLVKAVSKPSRTDFTPLRAKEIFGLEVIEDIFDRLDMKVTKNSSGMQRLCYQMEDERHFLPTGLLFIKTVEDPWMMACSKRTGNKYYYNVLSRESVFERPKGAVAGFKSCFTQRLFWAWENGVKLLDCHKAETGKVHRDEIINFVHRLKTT